MEIGETYMVNHERKGRFVGKLTGFDDEWANLEITAGVANAIIDYNIARKGEKIRVRRALCRFTEQCNAGQV